MGNDENSKPSKKTQMPGYQGNIYQTKLLMLYLQRGLKTNQNFELGTEIEEAHKFDDLVFKHKKVVDGKDKDHFVILQSKHKTAVDAKITYKDIFTDANNNFGLVKYYNAFKNVKNEKLFKNGVIEHAIIYTNTNFNLLEKIPEKDDNWKKMKNIKNIVVEIKTDQGDGLSLCKIEGGNYYRFKSDLVLPVLKPFLSIYHIIAQKLIKVLTNNKNCLSPDDEILKHYDYLLATEVIDVKNNTFRKEFIDDTNGNDTGRQKLRSAFNEVAKFEKFELNKIIGNKLKIRNDFGNKEKQQKWPKDIVDRDVEEFLKILVFATGQPDEEKLGKIILCELGDQYTSYDADFIYSYLTIEIQDWMKGGDFGYNKSKSTTECRFISSQDAEEFFKETKWKFNKIMKKLIMLKGPTLQYNNYFTKFDIEFDDTNFKRSIEVFLASDVRVLNIGSEHIIISSIKLYKELIKLNKLNDLIYVRLSSLNDNVINAFEYKSTDHLLVIELDLDKTKCDDWMEKIREIYDTIQNCNEKKLIIISNQIKFPENILKIKLPTGMKFNELNDDVNTLKNLTEDSQKRILDQEIKFQGFDIKLRHLIVNDDLKILINGDVLLKLLENEDIEIGKPVEGLKEEKTFYINRTFTCEIKTDENIYLLCGINEEDLCSEYQNLKVIEKSESTTKKEDDIFKHAVENNNSINVYLLRKTRDAFILLKKSKAPLKISNFKDSINCEVNLISAIAGMGKSTLFTNLSEKIKECNPTSWVIKINLNVVSSKLNKMNDRNMQFEDVVDFLHNAASLQSKLDKKVFEHYLQMGNVILYLDAFDEICPHYKHIVLKIIEELRENIKTKKIYISTRPYDLILKDLKGSIANVPLQHYNIEPFTIDNQKKYLESYWKQFTEINEGRFEVFVKELFELLSEKINDRRFEFLGVALHTKMIAVTLKNSFDEFQKSDSSEIVEQRKKLMKIIQLSELYEKFIRNKFDIYWLDKNCANLDTVSSRNLAEYMYDKFRNQSKFLALDALLDKNQLVIFLTKEDIDNLTKYKIKENGDELGIVTHVIDNKPHFIHRTFAEYFTAVFLRDVLKKQDEKSLKIIKYFLENMINQEHAVILQFMNNLFNFENSKQKNDYKKIIKDLNGREFYFVVKNNWHNVAIWLLENGIKLDYEVDDMNVLHLTCLYQDSEKKNDLLRLILEELKTKKQLMRFIKKNNKDGYTPLNVAVKNGRLLNVICMLKTYVEEKILDEAFIGENQKGENIFHLAAYKTCDDDTFIYLLKFACSDPVKFKNYFFKTDEWGHTPFCVVAYHGQLNKVKAILESNVDTEILDSVFANVDRDDRNVFHRTASYSCDDDTFIYLLKFASCDPVKLKNFLLKTNKWDETPLIVAVIYGQLNKLKIIFNSKDGSEFVDSVFGNVNCYGENIFHHAASYSCDDDTFIYLLKFVTSDLEIFKNYFFNTNERGETPLIMAVCYGQLNKLKTVFDSKNGSEFVDSVFDNVNCYGKNVFHQAATSYCDDDTFIYLLKFVSSDLVKLKNYLLTINEQGKTPLTVAVGYRQLNKLKILLDSNVDSDIVDSIFINMNKTWERITYFNDDPEYDMFIYLLKIASRDSVKLKNCLLNPENSGITPLTVAIKKLELNKLKALLDSNVDTEIVDIIFQKSEKHHILFY